MEARRACNEYHRPESNRSLALSLSDSFAGGIDLPVSRFPRTEAGLAHLSCELRGCQAGGVPAHVYK